jgi:hypothetical protein
MENGHMMRLFIPEIIVIIDPYLSKKYLKAEHVLFAVIYVEDLLVKRR